MKYLRKFETHSDYANYAQSLDFITPNVSYCVLENEVHYTPHIAETRLVAKFMVSDTTNPTNILDTESKGSVSVYATSIEIDGVEMDTPSNNYTFTTTGQHTVKYTLANDTLIPDYIFYGCANLTNIQIPRTVTQIGVQYGQVFMGCTGLTNIVIPPSVNSLVGTQIFSGCTSLETISINSNTITSIPSNFAENCSSLTDFTIPSSVTSIGAYAFVGCTALTTIKIPSSVTRIGNHAFNGTGLTSVYCYATTPPELEKDVEDIDRQTYSATTHVFGSSSDSSVDYPLYVPSESINSYKSILDTGNTVQYTPTWLYYKDRIYMIVYNNA